MAKDVTGKAGTRANNLPTVSISATADATEGGTEGNFRVVRANNPHGDFDLSVSFVDSGTFESGDFVASPSGSSLTFAANGATTVDITVTAQQDVDLDNETVIRTLQSGVLYTVFDASAQVTITDDDTATPTITITASDPAAIVSTGDTATFTLTRSGATTSDSPAITVTFGGTATLGTHYSLSASQPYVISAGQVSRTITVTPVSGTVDRTIIPTVASGSGYAVGSPSSATINLFAEANTALEADFLARISGPGVVWFHNFESDAEVDAFRWNNGIGNNPNGAGQGQYITRDPSDGITPGCLQIVRKAGTTDTGEWWRPFSPMTAPGNGKAANDPGANSTIAALTWNPVQGGNQTATHTVGYYGHESLDGDAGVTQDGHEYWLQMRVKKDPVQLSSQSSSGGKLIYLTRTDLSNTSQEVNTESLQRVGSANYFSMYRSGSPPLENDPPGLNVQGNQPGLEGGAIGDGVCRFDNNGGRLGNCWSWPLGEWVTVMWHVRPGTNAGGVLPSVSGDNPSGNNDTLIEVKVLEQGGEYWRTIWNQPDADVPWDRYPGHNSLICSGYMNGISCSDDFYQKYDEIIFSKKEIPLPGRARSSPDYASSMTLNRWYRVSGATPDLGLPASSTPADVYYSSAANAQWGTWNSFTWDKVNNKLLVYGGGHLDYAGSEVLAWDCYTREWTRAGLQGTGSLLDSGTIYSSNNSPRPPHVYYCNTYNERTGEFIMPQVQTANDGGGGTRWPYYNAFNAATGTWRQLGTVQNSVSLPQAWAVYDPLTNTLLYHHTSGVGKRFDVATETWSDFSYPGMNTENPCTLIPVNSTLRPNNFAAVLSPVPTNPSVCLVDFTSPASGSRIAPTLSGSFPSWWSGSYNQRFFDYCANLDAVLVGHPQVLSRNNLARLQVPTETITGTWAVSQIAMTEQTTIPSYDLGTTGSYTHNKARVADFNDGVSIIYFSPDRSMDVWAMRVV